VGGGGGGGGGSVGVDWELGGKFCNEMGAKLWVSDLGELLRNVCTNMEIIQGQVLRRRHEGVGESSTQCAWWERETR